MNKPIKRDIPDAITTIALKLIATGHVFTLVVLILGGGLIFKLKSAALADLLKLGLQSSFALVLGWTLAVAFFVLGFVIIRIQREFYQREIERLRQPTKGLAHETQSVLPLSHSGDAPPAAAGDSP